MAIPTKQQIEKWESLESENNKLFNDNKELISQLKKNHHESSIQSLFNHIELIHQSGRLSLTTKEKLFEILKPFRSF